MLSRAIDHKSIFKFYASHLAVAVIYLILLISIDIEDLNLVSFFLGFISIMTVHTPGMKTFANQRRYRFSFIKLINQLVNWFSYFDPYQNFPIINSLSRILVPTLMVWLWYIVFMSTGDILYVVSGAFLAEMTHWLVSFSDQFKVNSST